MTYRKLLLQITFLTLIVSAVSGCQNEDRELEARNAELDSLSNELAEQQQMVDSLRSLMNNSEMATGFPVYFGREFDSISNPEEFITNALKEQEDLIPLEGVLGGTMEFRQVQILTEDWVLAFFDDGHIEGKSIFAYELQPDGELEFTEIISELPDSR